MLFEKIWNRLEFPINYSSKSMIHHIFGDPYKNLITYKYTYIIKSSLIKNCVDGTFSRFLDLDLDLGLRFDNEKL